MRGPPLPRQGAATQFGSLRCAQLPLRVAGCGGSRLPARSHVVLGVPVVSVLPEVPPCTLARFSGAAHLGTLRSRRALSLSCPALLLRNVVLGLCFLPSALLLHTPAQPAGVKLSSISRAISSLTSCLTSHRYFSASLL